MLGTQDSSATLYDRIGGKAAVKAAVDLFYDKIMKDSLLRPFFASVDLKRQRGKQAAFLTAAFGGPTKYTGKDLRHGHAHLVARGMSDAHFNAVAAHLQSTLRDLAVPTPLIAEVMGLVGSTRDDVLGR
jgi:hemoglobin